MRIVRQLLWKTSCPTKKHSTWSALFCLFWLIHCSEAKVAFGQGIKLSLSKNFVVQLEIKGLVCNTSVFDKLLILGWRNLKGAKLRAALYYSLKPGVLRDVWSKPKGSKIWWKSIGLGIGKKTILWMLIGSSLKEWNWNLRHYFSDVHPPFHKSEVKKKPFQKKPEQYNDSVQQ